MESVLLPRPSKLLPDKSNYTRWIIARPGGHPWGRVFHTRPGLGTTVVVWVVQPSPGVPGVRMAILPEGSNLPCLVVLR